MSVKYRAIEMTAVMTMIMTIIILLFCIIIIMLLLYVLNFLFFFSFLFFLFFFLGGGGGGLFSCFLDEDSYNFFLFPFALHLEACTQTQLQRPYTDLWRGKKIILPFSLFIQKFFRIIQTRLILRSSRLKANGLEY